jgi:nitroreductase
MMMIKDMVLKARSYRRFKQSPISLDTLRELVDIARISPSGGNLQPLRYMIAADIDANAKIFSTTAWAGYLNNWDGPAEGERPTGYIIILHDKETANSAGCNHGIAAQNIVLGAAELGLGACMIGSIKRQELAKKLNISDRYNIMLIIALGIPSEEVVLDDIDDTQSIKYYRDKNDIHHVPKLTLDNVIISAC